MDTPADMKRDPNCMRCPLSDEGCLHICMDGVGPKHAKAMIVGEAPGSAEDKGKGPFMGKAGFLLDDIFDDFGMDRADYRITNSVRCRPPNNRTPTKREIRECNYWLMNEIDRVKPEFVILFGNAALESITGEKGITKKSGTPIEKDGITYFPVLHPASALHDPRNLPKIRHGIKTFRDLVKRGGMFEEDGLNHRIVTDKNLKQALKDIRTNIVVSFDSETSGLNPWLPGSWITSLGVGTKKYQWCFPLNHRLSPIFNKFKAQVRLVKKIAEAANQCHIRVAQNGKFDTLQLYVHYRVWIACTFDTMLAHYNLDENSFHGLSILSMKYFDAIDYDIPLTDKFGITGTLEDHCKYLALDIYYTRNLYFVLKKELKEDPSTYRLFTEFTMAESELYTEIELNGIYLDMDRLEESRRYWTGKRDRARKRLDRLVPSDNRWKNKKTKGWEVGINWASPIQVAEALFDILDLDVVKETPTGKRSTDEEVLLDLSHEHRVPKIILRWRSAEKNLNTFIDPWRKLAIERRLHPTFKIHGTRTGRPSAEEPNPQQTPRDPRIRSIITAPPGWTLVSGDLSQIELRLTADDSRDPELLLSYQTGVDVHTLTVMRIFGIPKPTKEERKKGKAINFGFIYGMWWKKFRLYAKNNFGIIFTIVEAKKIRKAFFRLYYGLEAWHKRKKAFARRNGYVRNKMGRKRRLPDAMLNDRSRECGEAERQAVNAPIQSMASDMNISAAIELKRRFPRSYFRVVSTTHDEILAEVRNDKLAKVLPIFYKTMCDPKLLRDFNVSFCIPIEAELSLGPWGSGKNWKEAA